MTKPRSALPWRVGPFVSSALMVVAVSLFLLQMVEGPPLRSATNLGNHGAAVRIVAIPATDHKDPGALTAALVDFATAHDVSIAFSRSHESGLVTVLDEHGRFHSGKGDLAAYLAAPGSGKTAVVSDVLSHGAIDASTLVPDEVTVTGTFTSDVQFEFQYPTLLFNVDAMPFGTGVYLFATGDPVHVEPAFTNELVRVFSVQGMDVVDVMPMQAPSLQVSLQEALVSPYGIVVLLFAAVVGLGLILVLLMHAAMQRERTIIEGILGATRRELRRLVARRLLAQVGPGIVSGGVVALVMLLRSQALAMAGLPTRLGALAAALAITLVTATLMSWGVGWREGRKVGHVVPC